MGSRHAERSIFAINNTGIFLTLSQRLNEGLSIAALQLFDPSTERDNLPVTIKETAGQYVRLIREIQPRGPYALVGWCNGGTLAFETARQLLESGEVVSRVFMIDTWVPGYFKRLGWLRSKLADYNYRWRLILLDWATVRSGQKSFWDFIANRSTVRRFYRRGPVAKVAAEPAYATAQAYDRWLLGYTTAMVNDYEPTPIGAQLTIFRSTSEPAGRFLDPKLGWDGMAVKWRRCGRCSRRSLHSFQRAWRIDHGEGYRGRFPIRRRRCRVRRHGCASKYRDEVITSCARSAEPGGEPPRPEIDRSRDFRRYWARSWCLGQSFGNSCQWRLSSRLSF